METEYEPSQIRHIESKFSDGFKINSDEKSIKDRMNYLKSMKIDNSIFKNFNNLQTLSIGQIDQKQKTMPPPKLEKGVKKGKILIILDLILL